VPLTLAGTGGSEFEFVTSEGIRRSPVSVSPVSLQWAKTHTHIQDGVSKLQLGLVPRAILVGIGLPPLRVLNQALNDFVQLVTQVDGHDGGRGLVGTQPVIISCQSNRGTVGRDGKWIGE